MKPDGVATTPAEPGEEVVEPVPEVATGEEQVQQDSSPTSSQLEKVEHEGEQDGATPAPPLPGKEVNGKISKPKVKTTAPLKTKPSTASTKATTTTGASSRPPTAQSRLGNGVVKTVSNGASKKPISMNSEMKKSAQVGVSSQVKKGPAATTLAPRTQVKAAERKAVGSTRPVPSTSSGARKPGAATSQASNSKPATGGSSAPVKPKTTAPRPATAPAAKTTASAAPKATTVPKTTRPTVATSRPTTSSAPVRPTATASRSTALRTTVSAPSGANSASSQPSKLSTTVAAKKEMKATTTSAATRKPLTTATTAAKASKPEPPKPAATVKRLATDTRTSQQKMDKVPTRKIPPSPRNISSRTASRRAAAEFGNHRQVGSNDLPPGKCQTAKPTQSVLPLVIKAKPSEEQSSKPVEPSAIIERAAAIAPVESVMEVKVASVELVQPDEQTSVRVEDQEEGVQVPAAEPTNVDIISTTETTDVEPPAIQSVANVPVLETSNPPNVVPESEIIHDENLVVAHGMKEQEHVTVSPSEVPNTAQEPPKDLEVVEKQEQIICNFEEEEEDEREGSQQVSVSDMSGTQPTEESRPGSAGLAGSLWRAGGLPSEFDSEDVSCSQQGASELSAPGVLEGTESMDDLGEASLKGADGEGASAGSPDFEKFPDIPVNEDDDDEDDEEDDDDRVDDMDVGSEMTEDPHRQCNDNEDEDEDVEMASEGVTESGLESYGNADEDDLADDYRLDNLNRMQPSSIVPALSSPNPFADAWMQSLQPDPMLLSSPSSNPWQTYSESPNQPAAQACLDIEGAKMDPAPAVMDPGPSSTWPSSELAAEIDMGLKQDLSSNSHLISQSSTLPDSEPAIHTPSGASTPEEPKDHSISPGLENQKQPFSASPVPVALPDIMQDLESCRSDHVGFEHEEEKPETLPADEMLADLSTALTSAPSSHSSATGDVVSDPEGDMLLSDPSEPASSENVLVCFDGTQVARSLSALVEESEEACAELDGGGGGGSDTPQSATSAASYGFEGTTSNSNAQSTTESCIKSPGIFSLENEEQLPDESKDPALIKELNLTPAGTPGDAVILEQQEECQLNSEQQYMLSGKAGEGLPETYSPSGPVPIETCLDSSSSPEPQQDLDLDAPHSYYSTICEKTDSFLTGSDLCVQQQDEVPTVSTRPPKHHYGLRVDHVTRLPTDLPPRMPSVGCNAQLRRLEQHQQQLEEIEQRREQQGQSVERQVERGAERNRGREREWEAEHESREEKERALEEQKRDLLHLQIQQQQEELKQRQQIMQWQQELEQQKQQSKHQKNVSTVVLSPSGLCTIYEALETSDAEEDETEEGEMVLKLQVEHEFSPKERSRIREAGSTSDNPDSPQSQNTSPSPNPVHEHEGLMHSMTSDSPPHSGTCSAQQLSPLELDWDKKADIVQQLINQTLLLNGDNCSPLMLLPGGAAGTLSPLETSLWPNLPPLTPTTATVTSVSSYSAELSGSSPKGEWTVVELETHH